MPSAAYTARAIDGGKRVQWLVELDLPRCSNTYTVAPCTAVNAGDGLRCWYSFPTCQDPANFGPPPGGPGTRTLRFCLSDVPWSDQNTVVYPYLLRPVNVPQEIDPGRLSVYPETVRLTMAADYDPAPPDHDKGAGKFNTTRSGEFWSNLLSRNRNYSGRAVRIYRGFSVPPNGFPLADFERLGPTYRLKAVERGATEVVLVCESVLAELDKRQIPITLSEDNVIENAGGISAVATSVQLTDVTEVPDPATGGPGGGPFVRNRIYLEIESEIVQVTAYDSGTNTATIVRAAFGTFASSHAQGTPVRHVAAFGDVLGAPGNALDFMQDLLEWAGVLAADVDSASFDKIRDVVWPDYNLLRVVRKPKKVSKLLQQLRETRGVAVFLAASGKFSAQAALPDAPAALLSDAHFVRNSVGILEDDEERITRALFFYDPVDDNAFDPEDFSRAVVVIDAQLESDHYFDGARERVILDLWLVPTVPVAEVRNIARRLITRYRFGVRTIAFALETRDATGLGVGALRNVQTFKLLGVDGQEEARTVLITSRKEIGRNATEFEGLDVGFGGRYLRMGPDTMAELYDSATATDRTYGYWGDADNRVGTINEDGYIYF